MTRNYSKVPDEKRQLLIDMIQQNMTIKDAARLVQIKYENAKAIYRVYRREQRTDKRRNRFRAKGGLPLGKPSDTIRKAKLHSIKANRRASGGMDQDDDSDSGDDYEPQSSDMEMDN